MQNLRQCLAFVLFSAIMLSSCVSEIDPFFSFTIDRRFDATIAASGTGIDTTLSFNIVDTANEFQRNSTSRDLTSSATLLKIGASTSGSLQAFDSIQYFVSDPSLGRVHIGTLAPMNDVTRQVLNPADTNISAFFKLSQFALETRVVSSRPMPQDIPLQVEQTFLIIATPR